MLRLILFLALLVGLSCSKEPPPTAPAGKRTSDDLFGLFDLFDSLQDSDGDTASDSTASSSPDSSSSSSPGHLVVGFGFLADGCGGDPGCGAAQIHREGAEEASRGDDHAGGDEYDRVPSAWTRLRD